MAAIPNKLTIGAASAPIATFENASDTNNDGIVKIGGTFQVDTIGNTLSIDTVTATVRNGAPADDGLTVYEIYLSPDNTVYLSSGNTVYSRLQASVPGGEKTDVDLRALPYGTPVSWQCDARTIAAFYLRDVGRVGRYLYQLNLFSGVGLLDRVDHAGGVYTGQTFTAVAAEIVGGMFPFTVVPALASQEVYGHLPYDSRRNNLHQLLFALGASLRRDESGAATIVFLTDVSPKTVGDDRVSFGGSVDYEVPATRAEVTEHSFFVSSRDEEVTLFDNTNGGNPASSTLVKFQQAPVHDLAVSGSLTIDSGGVNYAVVSGVGVLTGKLYTHTTRVVAVDAAAPAGAENVKHVEDMTLVSLANSLNVARRVLAYYSSAKTVRASVSLEGERCGDVLSVSDPFFEPMTAFLESVTVNASTNLWGPCRLIEGYTPQYQGNNVTGSETLTGSGTWVSPVTGTLQYVLVSGAQGGGAGSPGEDTPAPAISSYSYDGMYGTRTRARYIAPQNAKAGAGGAPGTGGTGGRVVSGTMAITAGQRIAYHCGAGGAGEVYGSGTGGAPGTDTTFGAYSTATGTTSDAGFIDPINGSQYGGKGTDGMPGSEGVGYKVDDEGNPYLYTPPPLTIDGQTYTAGAQGETAHAESGQTATHGVYGYNMPGGFGGGPAYKASGQDGGNGGGSLTSGAVTGRAAPGGIGADAAAPDKETVPGQGGRGGNGGGGAGAVGTGVKSGQSLYEQSEAWVENAYSGNADTPVTLSLVLSPAARGGYGSDGGAGADGIISLYWGD